MVRPPHLRNGLFIAIGMLAILLAGNKFSWFEHTATSAAEGNGAAGIELTATSNAPPVKRSSSAIAISSDGQTLIAVNPDSNSLSVVDLGEPPTVTELAVGADPRTVAVSDDGARAYTANRAGSSVSVIDLATRQVIGEISMGARPYGVVVSPDGRYLYVGRAGSRSTRRREYSIACDRLNLPCE